MREKTPKQKNALLVRKILKRCENSESLCYDIRGAYDSDCVLFAREIETYAERLEKQAHELKAAAAELAEVRKELGYA